MSGRAIHAELARTSPEGSPEGTLAWEEQVQENGPLISLTISGEALRSGLD